MTTLAMLGPLGFQEIVIIIVVLMLLFGAKRIPQFMKNLGEGVRSMKTSLNDVNEVEKELTSDRKNS